MHPIEQSRKDRTAFLDGLLAIAADCKTSSEFADHLHQWQLSQIEHWHVTLLKEVQALADELKELRADRDVAIRILSNQRSYEGNFRPQGLPPAPDKK